MLAGRKEKRDVPHEEGAWIEFRTLSGRELDEAQQAASARGIELLSKIEPGALQALQSNRQEATAPPALDKDILIRYGVVAWSILEPCTDENKAMLDAQTREWCASVITEMNTRSEGEGSGSAGNLNGDTSLVNSAELIG